MRCSKAFAPLLVAAFAKAQNTSTPNITAALGSTSELSLLNALVAQYPELVSTLANATNITVFAPSNSALQSIANNSAYTALAADPGFVQAFLTYHVLNETVLASNFSTTPKYLHTLLTNETLANVTGGQVVGARLVDNEAVLISGNGFRATVTTADVNITNGVVHIIDNILYPPPNVSVTAVEAGLTAFIGAVEATNLTEFVDYTKDLTIFAPSTEAFEAIGSILSTLSSETAASLLSYHVINGTVAYSSLLANGSSLNTTAGTPVNITIEDGEVFVNSARVIAADVLVANGVIHVLDAVLNPNSTATPDPNASSAIAAFSGASSGSVPYTSGLPTITGSPIITTTDAVASGYSSVGTGALASASSSIAAEASSSGFAPKATGAVGVAALFGGAVWLAQL